MSINRVGLVTNGLSVRFPVVWTQCSRTPFRHTPESGNGEHKRMNPATALINKQRHFQQFLLQLARVLVVVNNCCCVGGGEGLEQGLESDSEF